MKNESSLFVRWHDACFMYRKVVNSILSMILNYLKLSLRLLLRNPFFTFINVLGLSVGFAAFYILWPYTQSELHSDQFHKDYERIARLSWHHRWTDNNQDWHEFYHALNFCGIGKHIAEENSEVKDLTRLVLQKDFKIKMNGFASGVFVTVYKSDSTKEFFREEHTAYADQNFFEFFSFPLHFGDPLTVLTDPGSVVISQQHSIKYFGNANPINATLYINDSIPLKVTGVFKDLPRNTHLKFDLIITTAGIDRINARFVPDAFPDWIGANYIKVGDKAQLADLQRKIDARRKVYYKSNEVTEGTAFVQPLQDIVFTNLVDNPFTYKSKTGLIILEAMSLIILLLAWTNYIGLSITTLHKRLPEVGTRKVVGARNRDFIVQFFIESAIINLFSILFAFTLVQLFKAPAEYLFHFYVVDWEKIVDEHLVMFLLLPTAGIMVISVYPVLMSSKKGTVDLLKRLRSVETPWWIRSMVTLQYSSAVVLLIWIGAVYFQLNHILSKDMGVSRNGVLVVDCPLDRRDDYNNKLDYFVQEAITKNGIYKASVSKSVMGDQTGVPFFVKRSKNAIAMGLFSNGVVDENFLDLYEIKLLEGRNFQANLPADKYSVLISKIASERLGFSSPKECIGVKILLPNYNDREAEIIGVYEDYEFEPYFKQLQDKGQGSVLTYKNSIATDISPSKISFKVNLSKPALSIALLEELFKSTFPQETFNWVFLDQNITRHYAQETIIRNQIVLFTFLAIGIACLGLLGTTSNKVVEKTKEIGIRKVLGAQMYQIAKILLDTTTKQVLIANVIGIPVAYYLVQQYLDKFSERLTFHLWHYATPIILLLLIMFGTIARILLKAARTNPVESLRSE